VRQELTSLEGVDKAEVSFDDERAEVSYRPSQITPGQLVEAIDRTGFEATLVPAEDRPSDGGEPSTEKPGSER